MTMLECPLWANSGSSNPNIILGRAVAALMARIEYLSLLRSLFGLGIGSSVKRQMIVCQLNET
jgi:hypothetical protein